MRLAQLDAMPLCLVVEDHRDTREGYVEFLAFYGFDVLTASGADDMRRQLDLQVPDAIVMDLQLPGTDGYALIREIRADPRTREVPVVVVSASVREMDRAQARQAGGDAFVAKPCDPESVITELKALLGRARGSR